jgi:mycofactocin system creatininase family protein
MARPLGERRWPGLAGRPLVLVPLGSTEQHGPHLPLNTDTVIAEAVARAVAPRVGALLAPSIAYGASGEHQSFPGTCSIGHEALHLLLVELVRSLAFWAGRVVIVNAHGGNLQSLTAAVRQLIAEGHDVAWTACETESVDMHAGFTETSLMLHLAPWSVDLTRAEAGNTEPLHEILPILLEQGVGAVSPNGVLGNPTGASAGEGRRVLEALVEDARARVLFGKPDRVGRLAPTRQVAVS